MAEKTVLFMARTTRLHDFIRTLSTSLGVEVHVATPDSPAAAHDFDLLVLDADGVRPDRVDAMAKWLESRGGAPMLLVVDEEDIAEMRLPSRVRSDFICSGAGDAELVGNDEQHFPFVRMQFAISERRLQLNFQKHPNQIETAKADAAYSREVLLHRVWGFEYCGGTRTVDVHIRRIRSKVGPLIAAHITTVRGVGYLFKE